MGICQRKVRSQPDFFPLCRVGDDVVIKERQLLIAHKESMQLIPALGDIAVGGS